MDRITTPTEKRTNPQGSKAIQAFMDLVSQFSYQQEPRQQRKRLTNFTFFMGAGFSKSWDPKAPIGSELFKLKFDVIEQAADVGALTRMFGLNAFDEITPNQLRQIAYQVYMYERHPDVRSRYVDEQNLRMFRGALRAAVMDRYRKITNLNYFDTVISKFPLTSPVAGNRTSSASLGISTQG
jgi:hypothetical protein